MATRSWKTLKAARLASPAAARVQRRTEEELRELTLKELRQDFEVTQAQLAHVADMTQSEMSRLESRGDHRISTLRRYVEALGGEIEITAVIGRRRIKLTDV